MSELTSGGSFMKICVSSVGLELFDVYLAHESGNWGPEKDGDFKDHPFQFDGVDYALEVPNDLAKDEEFKIVVPVSDVTTAEDIFAYRVKVGVHIGTRFDFDADQNTFWLLAFNFPVVRAGEWNQNNVLSHAHE